jgi:ArsR family transcriptional regulator
VRQQVEITTKGTEGNPRLDEEQITRLVALGQALSDPIRVRMLGMMAEGRSCCSFSVLGVLAQDGEEELGICVCEFEDYFGMGQSKISYHIRKLKDAGLVREEKRGKWSFYSLNQETVREVLDKTAHHLGAASAIQI